MNRFKAFSIAIHRWRLCALLLAFAALVGCTNAASERPWRVDGVRADSESTPIGILALGTEISLGESGVRFTLGEASLSREAEFTKTDAGVMIELNANGRAVELEFVQLDEENAELRWTAGGRAVVAEMSRGGEK